MNDELLATLKKRLASEMLRFPTETFYLDEFLRDKVPDHMALELGRHLVKTFSEYPGVPEIERASKELLGLGRPELLPPKDFGPAPPPIHCKSCGDWGQVQDEAGLHYWCPEGCRAAFELRKAKPDILEVFNRNHERSSKLFNLQRVQSEKLAKQREQARREAEAKRAAAAEKKNPPADSGAA